MRNREITFKTTVIGSLVALWLVMLYLAFDHGTSGYDSMWVRLQTPLITPSDSLSIILPEENISWGKCKCDVALGCIFVTMGCAVRVVNEVIVVAPIDPAANTRIGNALFHCKTSMSGEVRVATQSESRRMLRECPVETENALTMLNYRRFNFHPYHSVINPTGALQHFSVLNATQHLLSQNGLQLPPRIITAPTSLRGHTIHPVPVAVTRFMEYALSHRYGENASGGGTKPGDVHVSIALEPTPNVSCSQYHTIRLLMTQGLFVHPKNGMTTPIPRQWAHTFVAFREMIRSRSLSDYGDVPISPMRPVLYVPRAKQVCDEDRVRFIPAVHKREMLKVFLKVTNSTEWEEDLFNGSLSTYPRHFHSVQSHRILLASEGAFFTLMLVGRPESVWVIYYRAPPRQYRSHGFFTAMSRILLDLKLVVFVVTNGISPPMSDLERAVREPFTPGVPKFVGADAVGNPPNYPGKDPIFSKCQDILR
jgi:hypothetical protein